ncbi:conserved hypothetical protein [Nitrolancea hollandica Lb]|uniref:Peptidase S8/S53 domain-containing protein n=1 Tax=Nitrolancea hollandica Lb TaxID=1129897 RepID=I4ECT4_9BACT|nr:conserved hypothetical protein [Nitrolancea hollandica Lb]
MAGAPDGAPAPFSRTGPGYTIDSSKSGIKPDLVHFGGNYALRSLAGGPAKWIGGHIFLGEPTIQKEKDGRVLGSAVGTSFACPHVTHAAALATVSLKESLGVDASANLIRAFVGSLTETPPCGCDWLQNEDTALRLSGYGIPIVNGSIWSRANHVRLVAQDAVEEGRFHIYRIQVPESFLSMKGKRGIGVALAYNPPVRASRKEYLARTMSIEVVHGLLIPEIETYFRPKQHENAPRLPDKYKISMRPSRTTVQWSTLQVRSRVWTQAPRLQTCGEDEAPHIHIVIDCQKRFSTGLNPKQDYGLVVYFWHEGEMVDIYQSLRSRVRLRVPRLHVIS